MGGAEVYEDPYSNDGGIAARFESQAALRTPQDGKNQDQLCVPPIHLWRLDAENVSPQNDSDLLLQHALSQFTRTMQRGVEVCVLLDDGRLLDVMATLDSDAAHVVLRVNGSEKSVALDEVEQVCGPGETHEACTTNREHLSDRCVTLVMSSTHFLTFSFDTARMREYFETCLKALVVSHHAKATPASWRSDLKVF